MLEFVRPDADRFPPTVGDFVDHTRLSGPGEHGAGLVGYVVLLAVVEGDCHCDVATVCVA
ncbi:Uncharacterised protein [Nocardia asteroides]|nr:hypothetical protein SAMN05444423_10291 [Nocardia asteroides]VEG35310.1 Uncharacterised protein [Nocardia asteroides]